MTQGTKLSEKLKRIYLVGEEGKEKSEAVILSLR